MRQRSHWHPSLLEALLVDLVTSPLQLLALLVVLASVRWRR